VRTFLILSMLVSGYLQAQIAHDLEVYSEDGKKFTLFLNGRQINEVPQANVRLENIQQDQVSSRVVFEDGSIPPINQKYFQIGEPGIEASPPQSTVYKIVLTKKKGYKLRLASMDEKKIQEDKIIIINN
jgi:hypothetical protein